MRISLSIRHDLKLDQDLSQILNSSINREHDKLVSNIQFNDIVGGYCLTYVRMQELIKAKLERGVM